MLQESDTAKSMIGLFSYQIHATVPAEQIAGLIAAEAAKFKFSVLTTYNFQEILKSKGFPIERKVYVFEICQANLASKMFTHFPDFSIFMPCKIAVYEQEGKTVIATMNMEAVLGSLAADPQIQAEAASLYNSIKALMDVLAAGQ